MIHARPSDERGHFRTDWLDSRHTFSFDTYYDPQQMGFRSLRVINEDRVQPGHGFPMHQHENMEVLTIVLSGRLQHQDSLGNGSVIGPWEIQRFTAGTGIRHSEVNPSDSEQVHLLQIWIVPATPDLPPSYEQKRFDPRDFEGQFRLVASADARHDSVLVHQDLSLYRAELAAGTSIEYPLSARRYAWLQVIDGEVESNGIRLQTGDGAALQRENPLRLRASKKASLLLFDMA